MEQYLLNDPQVRLISYQKLGAVISKFDVPFLHESENNRNFIGKSLRYFNGKNFRG